MRKIAQSTQDKFKNAIVKMMDELGAISTTNGIDNEFEFGVGEWELESQAGKVIFSLPTDHTYTFTLFGIFEDVDKTNEVLGEKFGHNTWSGKWNFHHSSTAKQLPDLIEFITHRIVSINL